jgi:hypothetical protein
MATNPFAGFHIDALKAALDALGIQYPSDASVETLGGMLQDAENIVDGTAFAQALDAANNYVAAAPKPKAPSKASTTTQPDGFVEVVGVGGIVSDTWNPPTHVEIGR